MFRWPFYMKRSDSIPLINILHLLADKSHAFFANVIGPKQIQSFKCFMKNEVFLFLSVKSKKLKLFLFIRYNGCAIDS